MGSYFSFLIKKILGQTPFGPEKKPQKFAHVPVNSAPIIKKEYVKPKPKAKNNYLEFHFSDSSVMTMVPMVIVGIIGITIFSQVYSVLNTSALGSSQFGPINSMMGLVPVIIVGAILIGIVTSVLRVTGCEIF